jgi:predicted dehydrogenase
MSNENPVTRRDVLGAGSALALGLLIGGTDTAEAVELIPEPEQGAGQKPAAAKPAGQAATAAKPTTTAPAPKTVVCGVIGLGDQGREILRALTYLPGAEVKMVCDIYAGVHKRALDIVPKAKATADYKELLADPAIQAVWVATPTHLHKEIAVAALQAGKNVFCEMPLAHTVDDAKAIAAAAKAASKSVFHSGLQERTNPQHHHVFKFVSTGALGRNIASASAQWNKKTSWRRTAATGDRERELNWRLDKSVSTGLVGEIGVHAIDTASHFMNSRPVAVQGFGSIALWNDGRAVADTVQCLIEFENGVRLSFGATLANSFSGNYELFQGSDAAVLLKDPIEKNTRAWMFKEADATALGWEVYAYREKVGDDTGIALVADASKLLALGLTPGENRQVDPKKTPLYHACEAFVEGVRAGKPTEAGIAEGYRATVVAIKTNEALTSGSRIELPKDLLEA